MPLELLIPKLYLWSGWAIIVCICSSLILPHQNSHKIAFKKILGIFAFVFSLVHLGIFLVLDFGFDFGFIYLELAQKRYLHFGILSFVCLFVCAVGSFGLFFRLRLFYLVLLALIFGLAHILLIQKVIRLWLFLLSLMIVISVSYKLLKAKNIGFKTKKQ
ncbi:hypothetical protein [Helicobacter sp. MIT 05-5294]|uniref:ferric reductase-like transmembrane domain-containing protein n=1 Tax=Helicobacter sp. MIT 05-5294 TaxID=1548150 RepID=UPI00051FD640|nr:hypothetical protein [Helicobacter sp. MIT 05-5294]TLD87877.1 hypothetical protein LS69_003585 [Helicobacter sp. MIT 05-5294]